MTTGINFKRFNVLDMVCENATYIIGFICKDIDLIMLRRECLIQREYFLKLETINLFCTKKTSVGLTCFWID